MRVIWTTPKVWVSKWGTPQSSMGSYGKLLDRKMRGRTVFPLFGDNMSKNFTEFCHRYDINPERRDLDSLQRMAQICQEVISQDCMYPSATFSNQAFEQYLALIHTYTDVFLPHAYSQDASIPALGNQSALHYAAIRGYDRYIHSLELIPSDVVNAQNQYGMSALHLAAIQSHLVTCQALCHLGADLHLLNKEGQLPLYCVLTDPTRPGAASVARQAAVFRDLWQRAPDTIQQQDRLDQNVTHLMAIYGHLDLLEEAMDYDPALVLRTNTSGAAAIHAAIDHQQLLVLKSIAGHVPATMALPGHKLRLPLHYAVLAEDNDMVAYCCSVNHDTAILNARDTDAKTAWMMASELGNQEILDILADYDVEKTSGFKRVY